MAKRGSEESGARPRVLVIGLDAATMDLIEPWAAAGHLPTLARLMKEGASARMISTPNMHSASAWTSILTGLNPGRHGLYVFSDRDFASGRQVFFKGGDRTGELISAHLARHGLTSGFLNVPMTYPAQAPAGSFMVSGLDAPALNRQSFAPEELGEELLEKFPDYHFTPRGLGDLMSAGRIEEAIAAWLCLIDTQTEAALYLLETRPVDFFMTVYTASDWGGHNLWKYIDPEHPEYDALRNGEPLLTIYRALDAAVARLIDKAGDQAQVYVISDHGMGRHTGASYHLAAWLEERGFMARKASASPKASLVGVGKRAAKALLPAALRERVKARLGAERLKQIQASEKDSFYSSIDWPRTVAYSEPGRHVININLEGRNFAGQVPASEYDATCERLIAELMSWRDERGVAVVERVVRRDEVYKGPFAARASDLYVYWNPAARVGPPPAEVRARGFWWSVDHRLEGILIAGGPGLRAGAKIDPPAVYDLVPTLLYLAGLPVSAGLDGRALTEICEADFLASHPLRVEETASAASGKLGEFDATEEEMVEEKLRSLGYL